MRRISERLAKAATSSFVGREAELTLLEEAINGAELPFAVVFVHGPGGIGKSRLLQAATSRLPHGTRCLPLDCRQVEPTPRGFLAALGAVVGIEPSAINQESVISSLAEGEMRTVVILDTYESFGLMDTWLRQAFVPELPESVLTIVAGREAPNPAWLTTPGWQELFREIHLQELPEGDALKMLESRGLAPPQAARVSRFAGGHPLALELAAASLRSQPGLDISERAPPRVLEQLTLAFLAGLPQESIDAVEAASTVRRVTEPLLAALLGGTASHSPYRNLQALPFATATPHGLTLHDVVRDTIAQDVARRDPERFRGYRRRAWRFLTGESHALGGNLWQCTADMLYLIQNPVVRDAFFPRGATEYRVEPATAADGDAILEIAASEDAEESARLIGRWWHAHPEAFSVARTGEGAIAGFYVIFEPSDVVPELLSDDPLTAAWSTHLRQNPMQAGERALFLRRWLATATGELPSPAQAACWLDIKRTYMELRPHLRRLYTTVTALHIYAPIVLPLRFAPVERMSLALGGATYHTALLDFGEGSVDGWLASLVDAEIGVGAEGTLLPEGMASIMFTDIADSTRLTEQLGDIPFRSRARELDSALRASIRENGGTAIEGKLLGDGVLAVFPSAHKAIACALRCSAIGETAGLPLHIGIHAGDVIHEGDNVFGGAVNIAAPHRGIFSARRDSRLRYRQKPSSNVG